VIAVVPKVTLCDNVFVELINTHEDTDMALSTTTVYKITVHTKAGRRYEFDDVVRSAELFLEHRGVNGTSFDEYDWVHTSDAERIYSVLRRDVTNTTALYYVFGGDRDLIAKFAAHLTSCVCCSYLKAA